MYRDLRSFVLRLGLHTVMSLLGSIGHTKAAFPGAACIGLFTSGTRSLTDVRSPPLNREFSEIFLDMNTYLQTFRNFTLWFKYTDMVDILRRFFNLL